MEFNDDDDVSNYKSKGSDAKKSPLSSYLNYLTIAQFLICFCASGILITKVAPLGSAKEAGLKVDDIVLAIDGTKVHLYDLSI